MHLDRVHSREGHRGDIGETVSRFISEHYVHRRPPRLLLTPTPLLDGLQQWLDERRGSTVEVRTPLRGDMVTLRTLADQNAEIQVTRLANKSSGSLEQRAADEAARLLNVEQMNHVVCFDMAQLQGDERVGASVVLRHGRPAKKEYRTYIVKGEAMDDLRMMREVVERWLKRQEEWPDVLLLDGGETHLNTIRSMLDEHGVRIDSYWQLSPNERKHCIRKEKTLLFSTDEAESLFMLVMRHIVSSIRFTENDARRVASATLSRMY